MPVTKFKGAKGDWELDVTSRKPSADTIKVKFTPTKDAKGCKDIRLSQTVKNSAYDKTGKLITTDQKKMLKAGKNPFDHYSDDQVTDEKGELVCIDHVKCEGDPYYNGNDVPHDGSSKGDATNGTPTSLSDSPSKPIPGPFVPGVEKVVDEFETCAICVETGAILGCITWKNEATKADRGDITVTSGKETPPSKTFKEALKKFMKNHSKIKPGEKQARFYCPDTDKTIKGPKGKTSEPYGDPIPEKFRNEYLALAPRKAKGGIKVAMKGIETGLGDLAFGGGRSFSSPAEAIAEAKTAPASAVLKFTWCGMQTKNITSIVLSAAQRFDPRQLAPFIPNDDRFLNDRTSLFAAQITDWEMQHLLDCLAVESGHLQSGDGPACVTVVAGLGGKNAAAFTGTLRESQIRSFAKNSAQHPELQETTFELLHFLANNYGNGNSQRTSYYRVIGGVRYDRELLQAAEDSVAGAGDGRISVADADFILGELLDAGKITTVERRTLNFIREHFKWTDAAIRHFEKRLSHPNDSDSRN